MKHSINKEMTMQPSAPFFFPSFAGPRLAAWLTFLIAAAVSLSFYFACAMPLAALATAAALTLSKRGALVFILAAWLCNQLVGFAFLDYPLDAQSIGWGIVIGMGAVFSVLAARWAVLKTGSEKPELLRVLAGFAAALFVSQLLLFAAAHTPLEGLQSASMEVVLWVISVNSLALICISALSKLAATSGFFAGAANRA